MRRLLLAALAPAAFVAIAARPTVALAQSAVFKSEYSKQLDDVEKKLVQLAEAMPADKYGWRPSKDVRSVGEVFLHIAGANFMIPGVLGLKSPVTVGNDFETKTTDKAQIVSLLKQSLAHARQAGAALTDADAGQEVSLFGMKLTKLGVVLLLANHMHEHMGQSIAYARSNGIVPPWSAKGGM